MMTVYQLMMVLKVQGEIESPNVLFHLVEKRLMLWNIYTPAIRPSFLKSHHVKPT